MKHKLLAAVAVILAFADIWAGYWLMSFADGWIRSAIGLSMAAGLYFLAMLFTFAMVNEVKP